MPGWAVMAVMAASHVRGRSTRGDWPARAPAFTAGGRTLVSKQAPRPSFCQRLHRRPSDTKAECALAIGLGRTVALHKRCHVRSGAAGAQGQRARPKEGRGSTQGQPDMGAAVIEWAPHGTRHETAWR
ncbi:hypothetical protein BS50DRAFT_230288 [Corynespora cassiicola Philippines]|uniref:Uncharacterized protein n=1 Tax=Corynespora cassiicola Philippines TaxID=1448308 RepID=A0A2T2N3H1_CORCC|nr:hypothetical protein BS50DRAFT_230288 [Corynespora cassiicola Philippines]